MTTITQRIPLDQITREAHQVSPGRSVLAVIAAVLFGLGWLAGRSFFALAWCAVAIRVGWQEGRHGGPAGTG